MTTKKRKADDVVTDEETSSERLLPNQSLPHQAQSIESNFSTGFLAYSKINPFASMLANNSIGKNPFSFSEPTAFPFAQNSTFGQPLSSSTASSPRSTTSVPANFPTISTASATTAAILAQGASRPVLSEPSPKQSPKVNPFSSPSPAHNPFVSMVESKDELWKKINGAKTTEAHSNSREGSSKFAFSDYSTADSFKVPDSSNSSSSMNPALTTLSDSKEKDKDKEARDEDGEEQAPEDSECDAAFPKIISLPLPENAMVVTGEEDEDLLLQIRVKLYRLQNVAAVQAAAAAVPSISAANVSGSSSLSAGNEGVTTGSSVAATETESEAAGEDTHPPSLSPASNSDRNNGSSSGSKPLTASQPQSEWVEVGIGPLKVLRRKDHDENGRTSLDQEHEQQNQGHDNTDKTDQDGNGQSNSHSARPKTSSSPARLVMRREDKKGGLGTKLLLNVRLNRFASVERQGDKMVRLICLYSLPASEASKGGQGGGGQGSGESQLSTFLLKTKTVQEADELVAVASRQINSNALWNT